MHSQEVEAGMGDETDDLQGELAKAGISAVASEELLLFDAMRAAYERNPQRAIQLRNKDDPLGFGVGEAVVLVTPTALKVASLVIDEITQYAGKTLAQRGLPGVVALFRRIVRRVRGKTTSSPRSKLRSPIPLDEDQLERVRRIALATAEESGLPADRAGLLADAVVGRLLRATR
jgi:hypothetical protein